MILHCRTSALRAETVKIGIKIQRRNRKNCCKYKFDIDVQDLSCLLSLARKQRFTFTQSPIQTMAKHGKRQKFLFRFALVI